MPFQMDAYSEPIPSAPFTAVPASLLSSFPAQLKQPSRPRSNIPKKQKDELGDQEYILHMKKLMKQREYAAKVRQDNLLKEKLKQATKVTAPSADKIITPFDQTKQAARLRRQKVGTSLI